MNIASFKIANNKTVIAQAVPNNAKNHGGNPLARTTKIQKQDAPERELNQLRFIDKLFLLSILDQHAQEHIPHEEFIDWEKIKYLNITPTIFSSTA